jgi:hypothetical protein
MFGLSAKAQIIPGPTNTENSDNQAPQVIPENEIEKSPFFHVTIKGKILTPHIWQMQIWNEDGQYLTYLCALGVASYNTQIFVATNKLTYEDLQKAKVAQEVADSARHKLERHLNKNYLENFQLYRASYYVSQDKKTIYGIGMVPLKNPLPLESMPDFLKSEDKHSLALVLEGTDSNKLYIYALGLGHDKKMQNALKEARKNSQEYLARFLGKKKINGFVMEDFSRASGQVSFAWVLGRSRVR